MVTALPLNSSGYSLSLFVSNKNAKANIRKVFLMSSNAHGSLSNKKNQFMGYYGNTQTDDKPFKISLILLPIWALILLKGTTHRT